MAQNPRPSPSPSPNPMEVKTDVGVVFQDRTSTQPLGHGVIIVRHENDEYFPHEDDVSRHYFGAREYGFLVISILHVTAYISVRLFTTVDRPREVVVIKRFWKYLNWEKSFNPGAPAEFLFSTLRTPATVRHLVLGEQLLPLAYMHAAAVKSFGASDLDASIWYKYYNGKELTDLIHHFNKYQRKVPEMFIWHFIADYGRALAYLHNGTYRSRLYNVTTYGHLGITPQYPIPAPPNIFLHYPSQEEKKLDPRLARYTDEFPQCILADFGQAFEQDDKRTRTMEWRGKKWRESIGEFRCFSEDKHAPPEVMTWHDKAFFGESLKALILASRMNPCKVPKAFQVPLVAMRASPSDKSLEQECKIRNMPQVSAFEMRQAVRGYSDDLIKVISRFEPIMHLVMD
ncbi:hypothetical protein QBC37DRAFT_463743 [Rhypophila decipiens]|uniref:Protein kinase domain-containing protein n=1 Tax=Rhypophila decipiens TaxID=261697 RepID=A0AAN6Y6F8_9PEZI|nr:hypothetical protein QBC37DRAFT_463743 [Rhypophila decipiens]